MNVNRLPPASASITIPKGDMKKKDWELAEEARKINSFNKKMNAFTVDERLEVDQNGKHYVNLTLKQRK
jgi:hypothetical protein